MIKIIGKNLHVEIRLGLRYRLRKLLGLKSAEPEEDPSTPVLANIHDAQLYLDRSHQLPHYLRDNPLYDSALPAIAQFIYRRAGRKIFVIDIGANIGDSAALIAAATTPSGSQFICVEADDQYLPLFEMNTQRLDARLVHAIAGEKSGTARYRAVGGGAGTSAIEASQTETNVVAIDDLTEGKQVDLLKIDTDGYEYQVLLGAKDVLRQPDLTVFMEYSPYHLLRHGKNDPGATINLLAAAGFREAIIYDNQGFLIGRVSLNGETLSQFTQYALQRPAFYFDLALHKSPAFMDALHASEAERIHKALPPRSSFHSI